LKIRKNNPIPYTLPLHSYRRLGKEYFITFSEEILEEKFMRIMVPNTLLYPSKVS
tara:strand:+ start:923 stop:1087 length:165 start_codon:yes stop_codon:yes gene_type:complete